MSASVSAALPDPIDAALLRAVQKGLPLVPRPYAVVAAELEPVGAALEVVAVVVPGTTGSPFEAPVPA